MVEHYQQCNSPVFKWSKVVRFANGLAFEWHLNTGQKSSVFEWLGGVRMKSRILPENV